MNSALLIAHTQLQQRRTAQENILKARTPLFLVISLVLTACQSVSVTPTPLPSPTILVQETPTPLPSPTPLPTPAPTTIPTPITALPPPAPVKGGVVTLGLVGQPQTLNPITENNAALRALTPLLFDQLLQVDPETAQLEPGLVHSWAYSADGQQVTFRFPPNLTWSNGSPLTAAAIAESLQATQHPALRSFSQISAPDNQTLTLTFTQIDCSAVTALAQLPLLPAEQILETTPVGSGPFMTADWSENKRILTLTQNPNYHGSTPFLDGLTVRFINESEVDLALSEGQFEVIGTLPAPVTVSNPGPLTDIAYSAPQVIYIALNFDPRDEAPLPVAVRKALLLALDRDTILTEALAGDGQLMAASLLPDHWAANTELQPPAYNPNAARALLAQAKLVDSDGDGWLDQNGKRVEIDIQLNGATMLHQRIGWLVSSYYRDLGLFARAQGIVSGDFIEFLFTHNFNLALFRWPMLLDPDQRLYWHSTENTAGEGLNFVSYNNSNLDNLLDNGVAVPGCQPKDRAGIYAQVQDILSQDRPVDFLIAPHQHIFVASQLQGLQPGPFAPFTWNVSMWHLQ